MVRCGDVCWLVYNLSGYRYLRNRYNICSPIPAKIKKTPSTPMPTPRPAEHEPITNTRPLTMQTAGTLCFECNRGRVDRPRYQSRARAKRNGDNRVKKIKDKSYSDISTHESMKKVKIIYGYKWFSKYGFGSLFNNPYRESAYKNGHVPMMRNVTLRDRMQMWWYDTKRGIFWC